MDSSILSLEERITIANSVLVSSIRDLYAACIRAGIDFDTFDPLTYEPESDAWTPEIGSVQRFSNIYKEAKAEVDRLS